MSVVSIVLAQVAYTGIGIGILAALGAFETRPTLAPALIGFPLGLAAVMLLAACAALLGLAVGPTALSLLAACGAGTALWRTRRHRDRAARPGNRRWDGIGLATRLVPAVALAWILLVAARAVAVKPLVEWDGWVLWATKARILYELPGEGATVLQSSFYGAPSYPPGLPALEATTMRAVGHFDGTLLDLQVLAIVVAALVGIGALLHGRAHATVTGLALLATLASSQVAFQLTTNYADVPLAFLTALGVVSGAVWLTAGEDRQLWQLGCFCAFLAAAAWTKNEGLVFAFAAIACLCGTTLAGRSHVRQALAAGVAVALLVAPWRVYAAAHDLKTYDYSLGDLLDLALLRHRADRLAPVARELLSEMAAVDVWGATLAVIVLSVVTALLTTRRGAGSYVAGWLILSFGGLVATYWISNHRLDNDLENSSYRTVVTLLVTGLCVAPLLIGSAVAGAVQTFGRSARVVALSTRRGPRSRRAAS